MKGAWAPCYRQRGSAIIESDHSSGLRGAVLRNHVALFVNGKLHQVSGADAFLSLSEFVRTRLAMTGTKVVCAEGDCGSCSVLCGRAGDEQFTYLPIDSCIQFVFQLDGAHIVTIEGLSQNGTLTPVQQAMVDCHGSQCGFCTPGFVMAMTALACESPPGTTIDWSRGLTGNLCRCTGYSPILAAGHASERVPQASLNELYPPRKMLAAAHERASEPFEVVDDASQPARRALGPVTLADAVMLRSQHPDAALVAGATDLGVQVNKRKVAPRTFIDLNRIAELDTITLSRDAKAYQLQAGARATWTRLGGVLQHEVPELHEIISIFGSPQIRHVGTIGGNLANASPIADSIPFLMVMEAELELLGPDGPRRVNINQFYKGYKKLDLLPGELIAAIHVTLPTPDECLRLIKVSRRRDLDISTMTAAIRMQIDGDQIEQASVALGGVGPTVIRATQTEQFLAGQPFTETSMQQAGDIACSEITPISDVRGSADFRFQLTRNVFLKLFHERAATAMP